MEEADSRAEAGRSTIEAMRVDLHDAESRAEVCADHSQALIAVETHCAPQWFTPRNVTRYSEERN